jgi:hypothetical protein
LLPADVSAIISHLTLLFREDSPMSIEREKSLSYLIAVATLGDRRESGDYDDGGEGL